MPVMELTLLHSKLSHFCSVFNALYNAQLYGLTAHIRVGFSGRPYIFIQDIDTSAKIVNARAIIEYACFKAGVKVEDLDISF
jgi:hypothetical protein